MQPDVIGNQRDSSDLELKTGIPQRLESLQLAPDADRHLPPGRITVREREYHQGPAVFGADLGHLVKHGVRDLAGRQVEVGTTFLCDRSEHGFERRLLAEEDQLERLGGADAVNPHRRLELGVVAP